MNHIVMATDGILECDKRRFDDDQSLIEILHDGSCLQIEPVLTNVLQWKGRDCATIIGWSIDTENKRCANNIKGVQGFILELLLLSNMDVIRFNHSLTCSMYSIALLASKLLISFITLIGNSK